jgi:gas vesicle protein
MRDIGLVFAGIGIGSAAGLLLAPGRGKDIRYAIGSGCRKATKTIKRQAESMRDRAEDLLEHAAYVQSHAKHLRKHGLHFVKKFRAA